MSHASKSLDALEEVQRIRDQMVAELERVDAIRDKLTAEQADMERRLILANTLAFLCDLNTRNMSEGQRLRLRGVKDGLKRVAA